MHADRKCNTVVSFWNLLPIMISFTFAAQTRVDLGIVSKVVIHWTGSFPDSHPWVNIPTTAPWCETHFLAHFEIQMFLNQPSSLCSSCTKPTLAAVNPKMVEVSTFSYLSGKGKKSHSNPEWFLSPFIKWALCETSMEYLGFQHVIIKLKPNLHVLHTGCTERKCILTGCHARDVLHWKSYFHGTECAGQGSLPQPCWFKREYGHICLSNVKQSSFFLILCTHGFGTYLKFFI